MSAGAPSQPLYDKFHMIIINTQEKKLPVLNILSSMLQVAKGKNDLYALLAWNGCIMIDD